MPGSRSSTPTPTTPTSRRHRPHSLIGAGRMRSDSYSAIMRSEPGTPAGGRPGTPGTPGRMVGGRPISQFLDNEQDMADLTAEMALLDDDVNSRSGKTLTSHGKGLRPLSLQYNPPPRPMSSDGGGFGGNLPFRNSRSMSNPPRPTFYSTNMYHSGGGSTSDLGGLSVLNDPYAEKDIFTTAKHMSLFIKAIYRLRFILRILSLMGSGCVLGVLAHVTAVYLRTQDREDEDTEERIWPEGIDLKPTNTLLAAAALGLVCSAGWLLGSLSQATRRLDGGSKTWVRWAALVSAALTTGLWIAVIVHSAVLKKSKTVKTLFWVCSFIKTLPTDAPDPGSVNFRLHCSELKTGWFASIGVVTVDGLILFTVASGMALRWMVGRQKGKGKARDWN